MTTRAERAYRAAVLRVLVDHGPRRLVRPNTAGAAWWLVSQGLVTHRDGIFVYTGPVKAEAVAS